MPLSNAQQNYKQQPQNIKQNYKNDSLQVSKFSDKIRHKHNFFTRKKKHRNL